LTQQLEMRQKGLELLSLTLVQKAQALRWKQPIPLL